MLEDSFSVYDLYIVNLSVLFSLVNPENKIELTIEMVIMEPLNKNTKFTSKTHLQKKNC